MPDSPLARWEVGLLLTILSTAGVAIVGASEHRSVTFDELVFVASSARGARLGNWSLNAPGQPLLGAYAYGLATLPMDISLPSEEPGWAIPRHYVYARVLFSDPANDPRALIRLPRLVATFCALAMIAGVFLFLRQRGPPAIALLGALLVAFLPDVLAHGGVAYNDMPLAALFFFGVWALEAAIRRPSIARGVLAGVVCAMAMTVKYTAGLLLPLAALLLIGEWIARGDRRWARRVLPAGVACVVVMYVVIALVGRGDWLLDSFRQALQTAASESASGRGLSSYLIGVRGSGWWYYFPAAYLFKLPIGFQLLTLLAVIGALARFKGSGFALRRLAGSPLRAPAIALLLFAVGVLNARLNVGVRHTLPMLPLAAVLVASSCGLLWRRGRRTHRALIFAGALAHAVSAVSFFPHYLAYTSEFVEADAGYTVLADSSLDWGQGLLDLRAFMDEEGIDRVYLAYFGSMLPEGYGIRYVPLPCYAPLIGGGGPAGDSKPKWAVVSATHLVGLYLDPERTLQLVADDPYAGFRAKKPYRVLGHTLFVYRLD